MSVVKSDVRSGSDTQLTIAALEMGMCNSPLRDTTQRMRGKGKREGEERETQRGRGRDRRQQ